ncbi:N-acetylmuramoyl-L-alanine amidase [Lichenihabitans psoromatis]|uniref:N-acetylmuramoyl-L-alanine amidase n=1 Tax=Lichenihabitans psoromatis TaxID=2528642 RepID=UPI0013F163CD
MSSDATPPGPTVSQPGTRLPLTIMASPNHGERLGAVPTILVLHYTGMPDGTSALAWLCNPVSQVSCHYVVEQDGGILQLVAEDRRAWHAGRSAWRGLTDLNSASIGIEIVNAGHDGGLPDYPAAQIAAVTDLCRDIVARYAIRPDNVLAHSDIAPGRKQDPGERFPWSTLAEAGVGLWVPPRPARSGPCLRIGDAGAPVETIQRKLAAFGYGLPITGSFDTATEAVVRSLQLHFRPERVDGVADPATLDTLDDLLAMLA